MSVKRKAEKRKIYFIKKEFQFYFILKFCLLIFVGVILSTGILFLFSQNTLTTSFQHSRISINNTGVAILPSVIYTNLITLGLVALAAIFVTLFVSHKIAGPMFRFQKELKSIGDGDLSRKVTNRKKDQITEISDSLNAMIESLNKKVLDIKTEVETILQTAGSQNTPEELIEKLNHLNEQIDNSFKI